MAISIRCKNPECARMCRFKDEYGGKSVKCPDCKQRITVPFQKPTLPSSDSAEELRPGHEPSAPRLQDRERPARRAVWLWLAGMAAMFLVAAGSGYFLAL